MLVPLELLETHLKHPSPMVRAWAWERLGEIYPERLPDFVSYALEEKDQWVLKEPLKIFQNHLSLIPEASRQALKEAVLKRLEGEEKQFLQQFLGASLSFLGAIEALATTLEERPWLFGRISLSEELYNLFFENLFLGLPFAEKERFISLLGQSFPEWEVYLAGFKIWETGDLSLVKEVYRRFHDSMTYILAGLPILPKEEYFLEILPEKERERFQKLENQKNRRAFRAFVEKEFERLREEVLSRRGELNLRRHMKKPKGLGVVFGTLETLLSVSAGDYSQPVVETLGFLLITLLWGKSLLGLPQDLPREELFELYFEKDRPIFPEDEDLRKRILDLLKQEEGLEEEVRHRLVEVFTEDSYGAERGVKLVEEYGRPFLPELLDFFEKAVREGFDDQRYIEDALKPWLKEEGVRQRLFRILDEYGDYSLFFLLAHYPTTRAALKLLEKFEDLLRKEFENLAWFVLLFPHPALWEEAKKWVHPRTRGWKETFVVLAHLFEPTFPGLKELEKEALEEEKELLSFDEMPLPTLPREMTLICQECGYYFPFKPRIILLVGDEAEPDLPEKVVCPKCGAEDRFVLPERESLSLKMQAALATRFEEKGLKSPNEWEDGVIPVLEFMATVKGRPRHFKRFRDFLAYYQRLLEENPNDPEILSGYLHTLIRGRRLDEAQEFLERLKDLEPGCVDYFYLRAIYHRLRGEPEKALEFYHKTIEALARRAPSYRIISQDPAQALRAFFFEAQQYAKEVGKPFGISEDILKERKKVGRNDPCPCGSGKKYKKCCLKKKEAREQKSAQSPEESRAFRLYEGFVARKYKRELQAFIEEWLPRFEEVSRELDPGREWASFLAEMFLFFGRGRSGSPLVEEFLKAKGRNLSEAERAILSSLLNSYPSLYEALEVEEEKGETLLKDRLTGEVFRVRDYSLAREIAPGEKLWGMLFKVGDYWRPARVSFSIPILKEPLVYKKLKEMLEASGEKDYPSFARRRPLEVSLEVMKVLFSPFDVRFVTPEGEEIVLVRAYYELLDPEIEERFPTEDFVKGDEHEYVLVEPAEGSPLSVGRLPGEGEEGRPGTLVVQTRFMGSYVEIGRVEFLPEKNRVKLEAFSPSRMERLRRAFEEIAGDGVRFLVEEISDFKKLMEEASRKGLGRREELPDEEAADLRWLEYLAWLDTPAPELEGRTPREAWQDPNLRPKVEELLKRFEYLEKQYQRRGHSSLNIKKLKLMLESA